MTLHRKFEGVRFSNASFSVRKLNKILLLAHIRRAEPGSRAHISSNMESSLFLICRKYWNTFRRIFEGANLQSNQFLETGYLK